MSTVHFIIITLLIALASAFVILFIGKIGLQEYVIEQAPKIISKLFSCDFCLSFWVSFCICIVMSLLNAEVYFLIIPFFSTPIIRILI